MTERFLLHQPCDEQWWPIARQLGLRLQRARIAKGLSQEALAHAAGISTYTYQKFEKGESRPGTPMNPRLRIVIALATVLDIQVEELVGGMSE
ncbi:helix-turn-helix transcriptional regulator [Actinomyces johnsonii]|uniref:Helix-turn-helix transcriptional regulator n=1 Tax=Actinomyces johnsonii TaxID=544581 RepID=A0A508A4G4_9ACTO|nr:helix-turn-helix transcriptional regulator [Actinomyces johnsonii]KAA8743304.1 helix-turn-helix transcriptional regulator [Actinomyces johnsonii]TQD44820.1 helix-turn-helix transcriptional regulator [Actinomyces johnsonii]